jgi:hypothetical protein
MLQYFPCTIEKDAEETEWSGDDEEKMDTLENDVGDTTKLAEGTTETTVGGKGREFLTKNKIRSRSDIKLSYFPGL